MKRKIRIVKNIIRCKVCGEILESKFGHDFVPCKCFRDSNGTKGCACDGGTNYLRRVGDVVYIEDLSETRPYTDEEVDEYNRQQEEFKKKYGWDWIDYMEK